MYLEIRKGKNIFDFNKFNIIFIYFMKKYYTYFFIDN